MSVGPLTLQPFARGCFASIAQASQVAFSSTSTLSFIKFVHISLHNGSLNAYAVQEFQYTTLRYITCSIKTMLYLLCVINLQ
jgi:hypothetical protein